MSYHVGNITIPPHLFHVGSFSNPREFDQSIQSANSFVQGVVEQQARALSVSRSQSISFASQEDYFKFNQSRRKTEAAPRLGSLNEAEEEPDEKDDSEETDASPEEVVVPPDSDQLAVFQPLEAVDESLLDEAEPPVHPEIRRDSRRSVGARRSTVSSDIAPHEADPSLPPQPVRRDSSRSPSPTSGRPSYGHRHSSHGSRSPSPFSSMRQSSRGTLPSHARPSVAFAGLEPPRGSHSGSHAARPSIAFVGEPEIINHEFHSERRGTMWAMRETIRKSLGGARRKSIYDLYDNARKRGKELQRTPLMQKVFEYSVYVFLLAVVYFLLVGVPLWKGLVWYLYIVAKYKSVIPGGSGITIGIAFL